MPTHDSRLIDRRGWLSWAGTGIASVALLDLLGRDGRAKAVKGEAGGAPHHKPKAKRAVHICLCGGMSHLDTFDYKPVLAKYHGKKLPGSEKPETFFGQIGLLRQSDWKFKKHGKSGLWISELFPHLATQADELTVIRSM